MVNFLRVLFCLIFVWCLLGCTVGPDYTAPKLYENAQIEKALDLKPVSKNKHSYTLFQDKVLAKLLTMAVCDSPSVRAAISKVKQARLSVRIAEVQGLPTLDAKGAYQYVSESKNIGYIFDEDIYQAGLDASWEIDIFGGTRRKTQAAIANTMQTIANLNNVYVSLTAEVALAYFGFRSAQTNEEILIQQLKIDKESLQNNQNLFQAGLTSQDVVNTSEIAVQQTKASLSAQQNAMAQYKTQLALLTGQLPNALDKLLVAQKENLIEKPFSFDIGLFYELPAMVIQDRPDVKAAEYALQAQSATIGVAVANLFPKITLSGMLGFEALHAKDLFNHKSYTYSYQPTLSVPVFYFGQLRNQVKIEKETYQEMLASYENTFLTAASEIKNALIGLQNAQNQYEAAQVSLEQTRSVYDLSTLRYQAGLINQTDFLSAQANLLTSRSDWIKANNAFYGAVIAFFKAIGAVS